MNTFPMPRFRWVGTPLGTTTDASGHYFLKNLPEGELTVEVRALGYATRQAAVTLTRGATLELNFEVEPERHLDGRGGGLGEPFGHAAA